MSKAWSIGKTDRFKMTSEIKKNIFMQNVGPDSYKLSNATRNKEPTWSFGIKPKKQDKSFSPSPGAYDMHLHKSVACSDASKWGFGSQRRKALANPTLSPGPGAYKTKSIAFEFKDPKFYMGEKIERKSTTNVPTSWAYSP